VLVGFAALDAEQRSAIGRALRDRVERGHSAETWADGVLRVVGEIASRA
jgi:hypothetical protein